jgi:hypothetical protein
MANNGMPFEAITWPAGRKFPGAVVVRRKHIKVSSDGRSEKGS